MKAVRNAGYKAQTGLEVWNTYYYLNATAMSAMSSFTDRRVVLHSPSQIDQTKAKEEGFETDMGDYDHMGDCHDEYGDQNTMSSYHDYGDMYGNAAYSDYRISYGNDN